MAAYSDLEEKLGLQFSDKSLLQRALTHRSYLNEHPDFPFEDNERLEFLGDAVLDFVTGEYLYHRFPELAEGPLTDLRSALVRRETLARFAQQLELGQLLLMGHGEAESGGRNRPATLCATFEALLGALYLDQGLEVVQQFVQKLVGSTLIDPLSRELFKDPKSQLQELAQNRVQSTPRYFTVAEIGPDHAKEFTVQVTIGGVVYGQGTGPNKQQAAQAAARDALGSLEGTAIGLQTTTEDAEPSPEGGQP